MSTTTNIQCPHCGQSALHLATRCPRCRKPFEGRFWQHPASGPRRRTMQPGVLIAGALIVVVVLAAVQQELRLSFSTSTAGASVGAGVAALPGRPRPEPQAVAPAPRPARVAVESVPSTPPEPVTQSAEQAASVAEPAHESVEPSAELAVAPAPHPAPPDSQSGELRYASTWVNVRARPSSQAPVLRILSPGDSVVVDSLRQGWYRAEVEGETLGYVDRTLVSADPRPRSP